MQEVMRAVHVTGVNITPSFNLKDFVEKCDKSDFFDSGTYEGLSLGPRNRFRKSSSNRVFISKRASNLAKTYEGHNPVYRILTYKNAMGELFFVVTTPTEYEETIEKGFQALKDTKALSVCSLNSPLDPNRLLIEMQGKKGLSYEDLTSEQFAEAMVRIKISLSWWRFSDLEWEVLRTMVQEMESDEYLDLAAALSGVGRKMLDTLRRLKLEGPESADIDLHAWEVSQYNPASVPLRNAKERGVKEIGQKVAAIQNSLKKQGWTGTPLDEAKTLHSAVDYFFSGQVETFVASTMRYYLGVLSDVNKKEEEAVQLTEGEWDYYAPLLRKAALEMTASTIRKHYGTQIRNEIYEAIERRCEVHIELAMAHPLKDPSKLDKVEGLVAKVKKEIGS
jgi:hypothetical protein